MVKIVETGNNKIYFCEHCGEDFSYFGMADNHEVYDCSPRKVEDYVKLKYMEKKLVDGDRYEHIFSILRNNELEEATVLIDQYKKEIDKLQKMAGILSETPKIRKMINPLLSNVRILNFQLTQRTEACMRERALDFSNAIEIWEELGEIDEAARVRKMMMEQGSVKVSQKVVHGDEISKTEIKDSVLNKSSVGNGEGEDKFAKLKELKEMFDSGFISQEEMEKVKKDIIG